MGLLARLCLDKCLLSTDRQPRHAAPAQFRFGSKVSFRAAQAMTAFGAELDVARAKLRRPMEPDNSPLLAALSLSLDHLRLQRINPSNPLCPLRKRRQALPCDRQTMLTPSVDRPSATPPTSARRRSPRRNRRGPHLRSHVQRSLGGRPQERLRHAPRLSNDAGSCVG